MIICGFLKTKMSKRYIRQGGLFRCCIQSILDYEGEETPGKTIIGCTYHKDPDEPIAKIAEDGIWDGLVVVVRWEKKMLTQEQVLEAIKSGHQFQCLDRRDLARLSDFFPISQWETLGIKINPKYDQSTFVQKEWILENVLEQLKNDVSFGFEKALNRRGISSSLMYEVVKMWLWILEDDLKDFNEYSMYGLPLFKKVAIKYGFPDEIDGYDGIESRFSEDYE